MTKDRVILMSAQMSLAALQALDISLHARYNTLHEMTQDRIVWVELKCVAAQMTALRAEMAKLEQEIVEYVGKVIKE